MSLLLLEDSLRESCEKMKIIYRDIWQVLSNNVLIDIARR